MTQPIRLPLIATVIVQYLQMISALECVQTDPPLTRTFDNILSFQANQIGFTPSRIGFQGNYVKFHFISIDKLPANTFITFDSEHIIGLSLNNKNIQVIEDGAFTGLECLNSLDLSDNSLSSLTNNTFQGLRRLERLDISGNNLGELPLYSFSVFSTLKFLNLSRNHLTTIRDPRVFYNLIMLETLDMQYNRLKVITPESLEELTALKYLNLGSNRLRYPDINKWDNISKSLETLDLSNNSIEHINFNINTPFPSMKTLNLSYNDLESLDVHLLKDKFPVLESIDINHNRIPCDALIVIRHEFYDLKIDYYGKDHSANTIDDLQCKSSATNKHKDQESDDPLMVALSALNFTSAHMTEIISGNDRNTRISNQMKETLTRVESLVVYLYMIFIIGLVIIIASKIGLCGRIIELCCDRPSMYRESYVEHVPLVRGR